MRKLRTVFQVFLGVVALLALLMVLALLFGPRTPVDTAITFDPSAIGADTQAYLAASEARIAGIKPNQQKQIIWAAPDTRGRTPIAIVYVHGFSASPGEIRPVPDQVAASLGANLYFARLQGHGLSTGTMQGMTVNGWLNDFAESIAIGELLGDRVVVIATSTGASLATWALAQPAFKDRIAAGILISPNFELQASGSFLLTAPFARQLTEMVVGKTRSFEPVTPLHAEYWTSTYPSDALLPMAETVKLSRAVSVEAIQTPVLAIISPDDSVVVPEATRAIIQRWGGPHKLLEITNGDDPYHHVLAGDALSPSTTVMTSDAIVDWIKSALTIP